MKRTGTPFLVLVFSVVFSLSLAAQTPVFFTPSQSVEPGNTFFAPIRVVGFANLTGFQFSVHWDPELLSFQGVQDMQMEGMTLDNFGLDSIAAGKMGVLWYDPATAGVTLADSAMIFNLLFQVVTAEGAETEISFGDSPTVREVYNTALQTVTAVFQEGMIEVLDLTANSVRNLRPDLASARPAYPNPLTRQAWWPLTFHAPFRGRLEVRDPSGRLLRTQEQRLAQGEHLLPIPRNWFPQAGAYLIQLRSADLSITQQLIVR